MFHLLSCRLKDTPVWIIAIVLIMGAGCSERYPDGFPKLYPTQIMITQEGQPLAEAHVRLYSLDEGNQWVSGSQTDTRGISVIQTHGKYSGAPVGKYKLLVSKILIEGDPPIPDIELAANPNLPRPKPQRYFFQVPAAYDDPKLTPFEIQVETKKNVFTFDIPEKVKIEIRNSGPR